MNVVVILRGNKRYVLTISSSDMCLHYSLNIYTLSVELFVCQSSKRGKIVRLYVQAISSLSGFDGFQTGTTETNEFYLMFYEFYILGISLTSLPQGNTSKSVSASPINYSGTKGMFT